MPTYFRPPDIDLFIREMNTFICILGEKVQQKLSQNGESLYSNRNFRDVHLTQAYKGTSFLRQLDCTSKLTTYFLL